MTTIATDGITIAADGQATLSWGQISKLHAKKIFVRPPLIFAAAGSDALALPLVEWWLAGHDPKEVPVAKSDTSWTLLVMLEPERAVSVSYDAPYPVEVEFPFTMGNGGEIAMGAMCAGASPEQAVRIAMKWHNGSGGEVMVANIIDVIADHARMLAASRQPLEFVEAAE